MLPIFERKEDSALLAHDAFNCEFKFASNGGADGVFEGYASVFNVEDRGADIVKPGAFAASLKSRPAAQVKMLYQHEARSPLGVWDEMAEDSKGLHVKGHLLLDLQQAKEAYILMKEGVLSAMSIGFRTIKDLIDRSSGVRQLLEVDLWEVSIVTFPMLPAATVTAVKGNPILPDARAMEQAYRDGGLSVSEAKIAVAVTKKMVLRDGVRIEPPRCDGAADALKSIRKAAALFTDN